MGGNFWLSFEIKERNLFLKFYLIAFIQEINLFKCLIYSSTIFLSVSAHKRRKTRRCLLMNLISVSDENFVRMFRAFLEKNFLMLVAKCGWKL